MSKLPQSSSLRQPKHARDYWYYLLSLCLDIRNQCLLNDPTIYTVISILYVLVYDIKDIKTVQQDSNIRIKNGSVVNSLMLL